MAERRIAIRRRFVRVGGREVHYLRAGTGPPVVLLHAANSSAHGELPLLERLASDHTVFAFDHPGYGDSDPLSKSKLQVADAAAALNSTLLVLKMPRCPVYGSHTGGAVALELARRHPARVAALIMDGVTIFAARETKFLLGEDYLPRFIVKDDGSHLFSTWVKTRDSAMWFPWNRRFARNRRPVPFSTPDVLHERFIERLRAGDGYRAVYGAVFKLDVRKAVAALTVPATFITHTNDPLFRHLDRLPQLKVRQRIVRHSGSYPDYLDRVAAVMRSYRVRAKAPPEALPRPSHFVDRHYVDLTHGQILVRSISTARRGRPLLLLHDGRDSSRAFAALMPMLARRCSVYAPDVPDNGTSDPLAGRRPDIHNYADAIEETVAALRTGPCDIYAVGAGAAVALDLLSRPAFAGARVLLEGPDFYAPAFARRLGREWAPPLEPRWDGAHLNRLWLMLRDEYAFWPWFDKSPAATCALDAPENWQGFHARVTDVLRSLSTYHRLTAAALRHDWRRALRRARRRRVILAITANDPRRVHTEAAARFARQRHAVLLPADLEAKAQKILRLLER